MGSRPLLLALAAVLCISQRVTAQVNTATVNGIVTDESKAVLPGVTILAADLETGREYEAMTDERGAYQFVSLPPGTYKLRATLTGFATAEVPRVEILVGQNATILLALKLANLQESVTVSTQAPLVDVTSSQVAGNVDRRQMEDLPLQGRNWMELSMLIKGITANNVTNTPGVSKDDAFQLNLDGQQITQKIAGSGLGQPKFSREAIAEFQIVTNLFDVTQGRSTGVQVQAISRSGTNNLSGALYGFFRSDKFNAPDPVAARVLPYSNQQAGGAIGGPVIKDKLHFFFSYEHEREPNTVFTKPAFLGGPSASFPFTVNQDSELGRMDWQISTRNSLNVRLSRWNWKNPFSLAGDAFPSQAGIVTQYSRDVVGTWSQALSNNRFAELRIAYAGFEGGNQPIPAVFGQRNYLFPGANVGAPYNTPYTWWMDTFQFRYDQTWHKDKHDIKFGGEYLRVHDSGVWLLQAAGRMYFTSLPSPSEMARRFPIDQWNNPAAWDLTGLDPIVQRFDINYDPQAWNVDVPRPTFAAWIADNWRIHDRLTVNYGLRWDDDEGAAAPPGVAPTSILINNGRDTGDFGYRNDIHDRRDFAPRVGFSYNVGGKNDFVIRGGSGMFYTTPVSNVVYSHQIYNHLIAASFVNDGRPGFVLDPTRGITPTQALAGQVPIPPQYKRILDPDTKMPHTWQSTIGFQKQLGSVLAIESDLTGWTWYNDTRSRDVNVFYNPANGYNIDPKFGRPNPNYSQIIWYQSTGTRNYLALTNGLRRRFQNGFQGGVTYTLMFYMHDDGDFGYTNGNENNVFDPLRGEWARSTDFQRNTVRAWTTYQFRGGLSVSGVYLYGSGNYYAGFISGTPFGEPGINRLNAGAPISIPATVVERWDGPAVIGTGQLAPRNGLHGTPLHKVDFRVQEEVKLTGKVRLQLTGEVFNLFDHHNFGAFVTQIDSASFGQPRQAVGNAYVPRSGQLGFRLSF